MRGLAVAGVVATVVVQRGALAQRLRTEVEVATGNQLGDAILAGVADLRRLEADVAAGHHRQHAVAIGVGDIQAGHAIERGLLLRQAIALVLPFGGGRNHGDVAAGLQCQRIGPPARH
ncbi:hypothetical protein G6F65_021924 [Rhizopus arrhizus]|nr:hypothetical protein G6F23_013720 [Rhizopus arrhizus]KAG1244238.1 hypothetical protein G6F65_021924 [Rhizopus arrhizus]KAG1390667.1 hypothetical protein G6F58_012925 [Rhizopus delemar]